MGSRQRIIFYILIGCASVLVLTGCALRSLFGNMIIVEDIGSEVNEIITTVFSDSTAAVCLDTDYGFFECTYIVEGDILTSTLYLLSEYGITGVLIDPAVVQVPEDVSAISATYDDGSGAKPLSIQVTNSFEVTPDIRVDAEPGKKLIFLELPASVTNNLIDEDPASAPDFDYTLSFTRTQPINDPIDPMRVKVMLTGSVLVNYHTYHVPILPCVTDFADVPEIEIPQSNTPVDLLPTVTSLVQAGVTTCDHMGYYYNNVPTPNLIFFPMVVN